MKRPKFYKGRRIAQNSVPTAGRIIVVLTVVLSLVFAGVLAGTRMLPGMYLAAACGVLFALCGVVAALVWKGTTHKRFWGGAILAGVFAVALLVGIGMAVRGQSTLQTVTTPKNEVVNVGTFVLADDPAESLMELAGYTFGVLESLDRESVEPSLEELRELLGEIQLREYSSPSELTDALLNSSVGAIVLNTAILDVLSDTEGDENIMDRLREITRVSIELATPEPDNTNQEIPFQQPKDEDSPITEDNVVAENRVITIFISGIDSREGLTARSRSDVNIIATVNRDTHQVLLVSTPRDYFVPLSISNGARDKLTHAGIYGIQVCVDTMEMLYGIDIDYYFRLNFEGFENIIDSLGGVTVYSDYTFKQTFYDYTYTKGENYLNGEQALYFARERFAFPDGDLQRGRNQMALIKGVIAKIQSVDVLTHYLSLMDAVEGSFETSIPYDLIADMVREQLDQGGSWEVVSHSVTGSSGMEVPWSLSLYAYVMIPDETSVETAKDMMAQVRRGEVVTSSQ